MRQANGFGVVDLTFERGGEVAVIPFVHVEGSMLAEPERSPLVWPQSIADAISDESVDAIAARLVPRLLARFLGRCFNREEILIYGDTGAFDRARMLGFLGAAPYETIAQAAAPYVYALRLATGARVCVVDTPAGANGIAVLARETQSVHVDLGSAEALDTACMWFGETFRSGPLPDSCDLAIGPIGARLPQAPARVILHDDGPGSIAIARSIPVDVLFSFDPGDSERVDGFTVSAPEPALRRTSWSVPAAVGGSTGRILFVLRDDGLGAGDSDTDDALALAARLRSEGFTVDVAPASGVADPGSYDLVHAFTLTAAKELSPILAAAKAKGIPVVATAHLDDIVREGVWGAKIAGGSALVTTDEELAYHLQALAERNIEMTGANPKGQEPYDGYTAIVEAALALCDAVIVSGPEEERFIAERFGYRGLLLSAGPVMDTPVEAPIGSLVGASDFILTHAPIGAKSNLLALVRAAHEADLPLVIAGPVAEAGYLSLLREAAGTRVSILTTATDAQIRALYRRARVFVEVGWEDRGPARAALAAMSGAALVLNRTDAAARSLAPGLWATDRCSIPDIASAMTAAWAGVGSPEALACSRRAAAYCDPVMSLSAVVGAYAHAQSLRATG